MQLGIVGLMQPPQVVPRALVERHLRERGYAVLQLSVEHLLGEHLRTGVHVEPALQSEKSKFKVRSNAQGERENHTNLVPRGVIANILFQALFDEIKFLSPQIVRLQRPLSVL